MAPRSGKAPRPALVDEEDFNESAEGGSSPTSDQSPCSAGAVGPGEKSGESVDSEDDGSTFGEEGEEEEDQGEESDRVSEESRGENEEVAAPVVQGPAAAVSGTGTEELLARATARCTELEKQLAQAVARKEALERCAVAQERELARLRKVAGEEGPALESASASVASTAIARLPLGGTSPSDPTAIVAVPPRLPLSASTPADDPRDFAIAVIMPKDFDKTHVPYNFKEARQGFPHRVQERNPGNTRQYVVESRLVTTLEVQLCKYPNVPAQRHASETELPFKGRVRFRLVPCLASTGMPLETCMFKAGVADNFFSPPIRPTDTQVMKNGRLTWSFKPTFLSRNTRPIAKQEVFFRITCVEPALADYNLETETERVLVVARETRKRAAPG